MIEISNYKLKRKLTIMRKLLILLLFLIFSISCENSSEKNVEGLIDDLGEAVSVSLPVKNAVTLAPNLTEIVYFIGAERFLAANTIYCNFPPEAGNKPKIGDLVNVDYEKLLALKPEIVLMTTEGNTKAQYEKIKSLKINVFVSNPRNFEDINKTILNFGKIFGREETAARKVERLKKETDLLVASAQNLAGKKMLFLISVKPFIAAGQNTFINEYVKALQLENVAGSSRLTYPIINAEEIINRRPDFIALPENQKKLFDEFIANNSFIKQIPAVKNNNIVYVEPDLFFRPGPRYVDALKNFVFALQKKVIKAAY